MTYSELENQVKHGKVGMLRNFDGYFKWNYTEQYMYLENGDYKCRADALPILDRNDFFYII